MADDRDPLIRLQLDLSPDQPGLLEGLDSWLRLGLMSDQQVRQLCQAQLSCELLPEVAGAIAPVLDNRANPFAEPGVSVTPGPDPLTDAVPPESVSAGAKTRATSTRRPPRTRSSATPRPPSPTHLWLNRLMSELSVVWLLGLGVFLVVLSSAVLAATQWANFNAAGQYVVLLTYTLVFWGAGLWCRRSANLQLTAKTLQMITLLLVPLNFWALDGLRLWQGSGVLVGAIAAVLLTLAALQVLRQQQSTSLEQANVLGLAYLHTGWGWGAMPLLAVYAGVVGSAAATLFGQQRQALSPAFRWPTVATIGAMGLLLVRGLAITEPQTLGLYGLAFGLYGATWVWLGQRRLSLHPNGLLPAAGSPPAAVLEATSHPTDPRSQGRTERWGIAVGRGLLLLGWLLAIADWLAQAFGVSWLGLGLRLQALGKFGKRRDLLIAFAIAVQLSFVGWELLPIALRQVILAPFIRWDNYEIGYWPLLGASLFPYVVAMVALADRHRRRGQTKLANFGDSVALGSNLLLTLISLASTPVLVVNLIASTVTSLVVALRRSPLARWRTWVTYGLGLASVMAAIGHRWPALPLDRWMIVGVGLAVVSIGLSKGLRGVWGNTAWLYGMGLSALTYALLWGHLVTHHYRSGLSWVGLIIPAVLTLTGRYPASVLTTAIALPLTLGLPWTRLVGLGSATLLTGANSTVYRRPGVAFLAVSFVLGWVYSSLNDWLPGFPRHLADWGLVTVGLMAVLWGAWRSLARQDLASSPPAASSDLTVDSNTAMPSLSALYRAACDRWGHILALGLLSLATLAIVLYYLDLREPRPLLVVVLIAFWLALGLRYWGQVRPITLYLAGWGGELLVAGLLVQRYSAPVALAVPTLGLGAIALGLAATAGRDRPTLVGPLQTLALLYAGLALALRAYTATAWTGGLVVVAALLVLEVGRRTQTALARWLALGLLSVGWYELVIYQMLQGTGGPAADALLVLAGVATLIMALYRLMAGQLDRRLGLPQVELVWAAHLHWLVGSLLMLGGGIGVSFAQATLGWLGLAIAAALIVYALSQGRVGPATSAQETWVYAGLIELMGWFALGRSLFTALSFLDNWWGVVACAVAVPVYWLPWAIWGWPQRPWRVMAVAVPLLITLITGGGAHIPTLWVLVGFYGWFAWHSGKIRLSYLAVGCAVWAILIWLETQAIRDDLAWILPLGLALLYIAQVDPTLRQPEGKEQRHWLRVIALGLVLLTALVTERWAGLPVGAMAMGAIAAGLFFRLRAPLYVGTGVFVLNALNQLVLLNAAFPFFKWVAGIVVGIALIWIAADVERRRDQWLQLTQSWGQDLDQWQ
ncbi:hypothetical protein [Nodosilinea sp. E11]|uniref:hypothetical protein n=1 Tax=Nodosilinea sp. E11 TaxID=3037479 RepID=UPI002934CE45|nr:hypothetical protein [Nodosilinea sp. E11]WOD39288.1 hypothetical protein RRF56_24070 [Nodosilinea sp. E11]